VSFKKFIAGFDNHGEEQDGPACDVFFQFLDQWKPDLRIHGGDNWDFRPIRAGAKEDERRESMRPDFKAGKAFLERYVPTHFLRGNHDERLWKLAENGCGPAADLAQEGVEEVNALMSYLHCQMLPYDKRKGVLRVADTLFLHGMRAGESAVRRTVMDYGGFSIVMGHIHAVDFISLPGLEQPRIGIAAGCLAQHEMGYNAASPGTMRYENGFVYGVYDDSVCITWQARKRSGKWFLPSDIYEWSIQNQAMIGSPS
jgi:hypothetical protein